MILFLEDRPSRQLMYLPNKNQDVEVIKQLKEIFMPLGFDCQSIIDQINVGEYKFDQQLKLIIVHKSALNTKGLLYIDKFCKSNKVQFICYSGGISQIYYSHIEYEFLNINSTDFYTERLIPFLKNIIENKLDSLLDLVNKDWKISYLFLARQLLSNLTIEKDEDVLYNFETKLENISKILKLNFALTNENIDRLNREIKKHIISL